MKTPARDLGLVLVQIEAELDLAPLSERLKRSLKGRLSLLPVLALDGHSRSMPVAHGSHEGKLLATASAPTALFRRSFKGEPTTIKPLRIGIVGYGFMGRTHAMVCKVFIFVQIQEEEFMNTSDDREFELALMSWESEGGFIPENTEKTKMETDTQASGEEAQDCVDDQNAGCSRRQEPPFASR